MIGLGSTPARDNARYLMRRIDVCRALGAETIQMAGVGGYRRFPHEPLAPEIFRAAHEAYIADMKEAGTYAQERDIILAPKPHTGNTATAEHLARLLPEIDRPSVRPVTTREMSTITKAYLPKMIFPILQTKPVK